LLSDEGEHGAKENNNAAAATDSIWSPKALGVQSLDATDPRIEMSRTESEMDAYVVCNEIKVNYIWTLWTMFHESMRYIL